ncbi:MAG: hypothetical protein V3V74_06390 [Nitrosomonadaceae bacterium]
MNKVLTPILSIIVLVTILHGCISITTYKAVKIKDHFPEVMARRPPDVKLSEELILLEKPPKRLTNSTSLISKDGRAHVFVIDKKSHIYHIEIFGDKVINQEHLGEIETKGLMALDAVEHPPGTLRVLAGDKQYFRTAHNLNWQEVKGNRCTRFVPVGDELFCAFVAEGEEVTAPERTDYIVGWFILVPIVLWSHDHASKLVLAQESQDGWIVRAVLDPDTPLDADHDFMVGTDSMGNIHFLYDTSKGSATFFISPLLVDAVGSASKHKLQYAQLAIDQLLAHSRNTQNQVPSLVAAPVKWLTVNGAPLTHLPLTKQKNTEDHLFAETSIKYFLPRYLPQHPSLSPLHRNFSVNKVTGDVSGQMWTTTSGFPLDDGNRHLLLRSSLLEVSIRNGQWSPHFNIVTAKDFLTKSSWDNLVDFLFKADGKGKYHVLLKSWKTGFWKTRKYMHYLVKDDVNWSAPLTLGSSSYSPTYDASSLAVDDSGVAFAAWVNKEKQFIGRWIRPRESNLQ